MREYIITCDEETALWVASDVDSMKPIIRCRDCAYIFHRKYNNGFEYQTCSYFDSEHAEAELDGFCAWGERKEGSE